MRGLRVGLPRRGFGQNVGRVVVEGKEESISLLCKHRGSGVKGRLFEEDSDTSRHFPTGFSNFLGVSCNFLGMDGLFPVVDFSDEKRLSVQIEDLR